MIKFKTASEQDMRHLVTYGGKQIEVLIQRMTGRVYEPGVTKLADGRSEFHDKEGKPDTRIMVMGTSFKEPFYKVVTEEELHSQFDETKP